MVDREKVDTVNQLFCFCFLFVCFLWIHTVSVSFMFMELNTRQRCAVIFTDPNLLFRTFYNVVNERSQEYTCLTQQRLS